MKFSEMPYTRPNLDELKAQQTQLTHRLEQAASYEEARAVFVENDTLDKHVMTLSQLAHVRHYIDTRDPFYDQESTFWDNAAPELEEYGQAFTAALLSSPFRPQFEDEFGNVLFINAEIRLKTFSPEIVSLLQEENEVAQAYEKLLASAQIPFDGRMYTLSQISPLKNDADDALRLRAWKAEGQWYKDNQDKLDGQYDRLAQLRDQIAKKLGYDNYLPLGYYRMTRNCYTREDVEQFRKAVRTYVVPVAAEIYRKQAQRLGKDYPMSYADCALHFRSGNPCPSGDADAIVAHATAFYDALSPETGAFFHDMVDNQMLDLLSTEGKSTGGFCTGIPDYRLPFIFANFNGTQHDVEVVTHEAGHAFAYYMNRDRVPASTSWPSLEACEVHSMSMEFMAWPWAEGFFGKDTEKFYYSHLTGSLTFIPYGTMVDHFQHEVYLHPEMTPAERHAVWKKLTGEYMPWIKLDGEIPFYGDGEAWQRQHHIYSSPLYYIDYCLAQTVALQFWALLQKDRKLAWNRYMAYTKLGGSMTFTELLKQAGLESPFEANCLRDVCEEADHWLAGFDQNKLK